MQEVKDLPDAVLTLQGMAQWQVAVQLVPVAAPVACAGEIARIDELGHDALGGALGDADLHRRVAIADTGVSRGRAIYDNVVKFVRFQLSTNAGAIFTFLGATATGLPAPLTAIQVLWVNIIMDGPPAMALGVDPARPEVMDRPPRRGNERILSGSRLVRIFRAGAVMALGTLGVLAYAQQQYTEAVALTMAFTTFVLFQFFNALNALNARTEDRTVFSRYLFTNRPLWISLGAVVVLQVAAVTILMLEAFGQTRPPRRDPTMNQFRLRAFLGGWP